MFLVITYEAGKCSNGFSIKKSCTDVLLERETKRACLYSLLVYCLANPAQRGSQFCLNESIKHFKFLYFSCT